MNIFITLDYELFLGKETGSVNNCLVLPTTALMDVFSETDTKVTFMVDGAYLYRLVELRDKYDAIQRDYEMVKNNLIDINRRGHSIQYHFILSGYIPNLTLEKDGFSIMSIIN